MDKCLDPIAAVECHHPCAARLQAIKESKNIADFLLDIKRNILKPAQMEECWDCYLLDIRMRQNWNIEHVAVLADKLSKVAC